MKNGARISLDDAPTDDPDFGEGSPRIFLYSHDAFGLGHLRRNLNLAAAMSEAFPSAAVLLVTGSPCATFFTPPPRVEIVKLPSVTKDENGAYVPRSLPGSLSGSLHLRRSLLLEAFRVFQPELLVVDHQVIGMHGEVLPLLKESRRRGTRTILGVRDVIDAPEVVAREWGAPECRTALVESYDRVCVYGVPEIFDARAEYPIPPELGARLEFTGYVTPPRESFVRRAIPAARPQVLVTAGGGEDGAARIDAYLDAIGTSEPAWDSVVVTGPLLDAKEARRLKRRARLAGRVELHRFHADLPRLIADAHAVVSMCGYNSCAELLQSRKPVVYLPRTRPRREQEIRATRLSRNGLCQTLVEPHPRELFRAVERAVASGPLRVQLPSLAGAKRLTEIARELLGAADLGVRLRGSRSARS